MLHPGGSHFGNMLPNLMHFDKQNSSTATADEQHHSTRASSASAADFYQMMVENNNNNNNNNNSSSFVPTSTAPLLTPPPALALAPPPPPELLLRGSSSNCGNPFLPQFPGLISPQAVSAVAFHQHLYALQLAKWADRLAATHTFPTHGAFPPATTLLPPLLPPPRGGVGGGGVLVHPEKQYHQERESAAESSNPAESSSTTEISFSSVAAGGGAELTKRDAESPVARVEGSPPGTSQDNRAPWRSTEAPTRSFWNDENPLPLSDAFNLKFGVRQILSSPTLEVEKPSSSSPHSSASSAIMHAMPPTPFNPSESLVCLVS